MDTDLRAYKVRVFQTDHMGWTWEGKGPGDQDFGPERTADSDGFFRSEDDAADDAITTLEDHYAQQEWVDAETLRLNLMKRRREQ